MITYISVITSPTFHTVSCNKTLIGINREIRLRNTLQFSKKLSSNDSSTSEQYEIFK